MKLEPSVELDLSNEVVVISFERPRPGLGPNPEIRFELMAGEAVKLLDQLQIELAPFYNP